MTTKTPTPTTHAEARGVVHTLADRTRHGNTAARRRFIALAREAGLTGKSGGWIYGRTSTSGSITQGWASVASYIAAGSLSRYAEAMAWHLLSADTDEVRVAAEAEHDYRATVAQWAAWNLAHGIPEWMTGARYADAALAAIESDHAVALIEDAARDYSQAREDAIDAGVPPAKLHVADMTADENPGKAARYLRVATKVEMWAEDDDDQARRDHEDHLAIRDTDRARICLDCAGIGCPECGGLGRIPVDQAREDGPWTADDQLAAEALAEKIRSLYNATDGRDGFLSDPGGWIAYLDLTDDDALAAAAIAVIDAEGSPESAALPDRVAATLRATGRYGSEAGEVVADVLAALRAEGLAVVPVEDLPTEPASEETGLARYDKGNNCGECDYCTARLVSVWHSADGWYAAACATHRPRVLALIENQRPDRASVLADVARYHHETEK